MSNTDKIDNPIVVNNAAIKPIILSVSLEYKKSSLIGSNSSSKVEENIVWNPFEPMPNDSETFLNWV